LPLIEQYPNYQYLETVFRTGQLKNLTDTFYRSKSVWRERKSESFFAECGWYKFPYCSFVPYYSPINHHSIIGLMQSELHSSTNDIVKELWVSLHKATEHKDWIPFGAELNVVFPGASILPHTDNHFYSDYATRCHVVLETNNKVLFRFASESKDPKFKVGDSFIFNNKRKQHIKNLGDTNRLHLVVDFLPKEVFQYTERSILPFGSQNALHILHGLPTEHKLYDQYIDHIDGFPIPRKKIYGI
jgi:hypothetical protein